MMTLGIILIIIGIISVILCIILRFRGYNDKPYILLCYLMLLIPMGVALIMNNKNPKSTKQDVLDGKAIYQENTHIRDNDTIKTYEIIWKQKN